jgi:N-acetylneuraminic acid mutarotase
VHAAELRGGALMTMRSLGIAAVLAACTTSPTRIELAVSADPAWQVDHYELRIGDHATGAAPLSKLELQLPDDMAGHTQDVSVWGLVGGMQVAYGTTSVTPSMHGTVSAQVTLAAISCGTFCTEGDVECSGNGTSTCQMQADGCLSWSTPMACPSTMPYCSNGACGAQCSDECMTGQTECDSPATVRMCGQFDSDSCLDWSAPMACGMGRTCTGGMCMTTTTCPHNGDSCDDGDACTEHDTCENGACSGTPKCTSAPADADPTCSGGTCGFKCRAGLTKSGSQCVVAAVSQMQIERKLPAAAVGPDGRIYAIGGESSSAVLTQVEAYDPSTNTWTTRATLPSPRAELAAVRGPDGRVYAIGGYYASLPLSLVTAYDATSNVWASRAPMPTARLGLGAAVGSDGLIYAVGGSQTGTSGSIYATVEAYNPATDTWKTRAPLPQARVDLAVAGANGLVYALGGHDASGVTTATLWVYDPASNAWSTRAPMHTARAHLAAAFGSDGKLYAIGGDDASNPPNPLSSVEAYDPATNTWTSRAAMPIARGALAAVLGPNGLIYAIGGQDGGGYILPDVEAYSAASNTW